MYMDNYEGISSLIGQRATEQLVMLVGSVLCNRNALDEVPELQPKLARADMRFAKALAEAGDDWNPVMDRWARRAPFCTSPWWLSVRNMSRQLGGSATTIPDLFAPFADIWARAKEFLHEAPDQPPVNLSKLVNGIRTGVKAMVSDLREAARITSESLDLEAIPAVQVPGSVNIGFVVRHHGSEHEAGREAAVVARTYVAAMRILGEGGEEADLSALVVTPQGRGEFLESFKEVRNSLPNDVRLHLLTSVADAEPPAVIRNLRTKRSYERRARIAPVNGIVRGVELDEREIVVRDIGGRGKTVVRCARRDLLQSPIDVEPYLNAHVELQVRTTHPSNPPRRGDLVGEISVIRCPGGAGAALPGH